MFDPRVRTYALSMVKIPAPTSGVRVEVKTEELWITNVIPAPIRRAKYLKKSIDGFFKKKSSSTHKGHRIALGTVK